MKRLPIGCGQLTWSGFTEDEVLAEIASAGYDGAPGNLNMDRSATEVIAQFATHGLRPAPPYFHGRFWDPAAEAEIVDAAGSVTRRIRELGCTELYVAAAGTPDTFANARTRAEIAGHVSPEDAIDDDAFAQFGRVLSEFARLTQLEGVATCFHNHVGTVIETGSELKSLLAACTDDVMLGLDTGHLAWAGEDAAAICHQYGDRVRSLHLKDVYPAVREEGRRAGWDYATFTKHGIFAELGEGCVDFPAIIEDLRTRAYKGWLIVETDVTTKPTALASAEISRAYLRTLDL